MRHVSAQVSNLSVASKRSVRKLMTSSLRWDELFAVFANICTITEILTVKHSPDTKEPLQSLSQLAFPVHHSTLEGIKDASRASKTVYYGYRWASCRSRRCKCGGQCSWLRRRRQTLISTIRVYPITCPLIDRRSRKRADLHEFAKSTCRGDGDGLCS